MRQLTSLYGNGCSAPLMHWLQEMEQNHRPGHLHSQILYPAANQTPDIRNVVNGPMAIMDASD
jgi:hypothetical protein